MELQVFEDFDKMQLKIYLKVMRGDQLWLIGYDGNNIIEQLIPRDGSVVDFPPKPLLIIPYFMKDAIFAAFANYLSGQNIKTENENLLKGKLEATEKHLVDMQEFAKKWSDFCMNTQTLFRPK